MALAVGDTLGPYQIVAKLGAGGMGEVYRALDTRIGREVAIKVSAEQFNDRSEREARAVASLNHPNVCTLHDVGPNYLVMELVEGDEPKGPMPLDDRAALRAADRRRPRCRAREGHHPSRSQAGQHQDPPLTAPSRCSTSASRRSCRPTQRSRSAHDLSHSPTMPIGHDAGGDDSRHRRVHGARAGARQARGQARRHLGVRRRLLRDADRPPRVRRRRRVVDSGGGDPVRAALGRCARDVRPLLRELSPEGSQEAAARHWRRWKLLDDQPAAPPRLARSRVAGLAGRGTCRGRGRDRTLGAVARRRAAGGAAGRTARRRSRTGRVAGAARCARRSAASSSRRTARASPTLASVVSGGPRALHAAVGPAERHRAGGHGGCGQPILFAGWSVARHSGTASASRRSRWTAARWFALARDVGDDRRNMERRRRSRHRGRHSSAAGLLRLPSSGGAATPILELAKGEMFHMAPQMLPGREVPARRNVVEFPTQRRTTRRSTSSRSPIAAARRWCEGRTMRRYLASGHLIYTNKADDVRRAVRSGDAGDRAAAPSSCWTISPTIPWRTRPSSTCRARARSCIGERRRRTDDRPRCSGSIAAGKQEPSLAKPAEYVSTPRVSPDGRRLALAIRDGSNQDIWLSIASARR